MRTQVNRSANCVVHANRNIRLSIFVCLMIALCCSSSVSAQDKTQEHGNTEQQAVDFQSQIQPLLANRCLACHGPDQNAREADLRLDTEDGAKAWAIVPGDPQQSELISRVQSTDPDMMMPPPGHGDSLKPEEIQLLRQWIAEGAVWQKHWAFQPIVAPKVPEDETGWSHSPLDHFVLHQMKQVGLTPQQPADKRRLIRRVYLDLIGIPPTVDEVDQWVNGEVTFEEVVDRLLQSTHYGEQMAVSWLDLARYADTNGFQNDFRRSMWVWRDWVIEAFNQNMPIDDFIVQQLAGDLLPEPSVQQLIATGFNRNNPSVTEGGTIEEEWRIENAVDRTETTAAALLGLTIGCARCHDHKYDPVSQKEFYQFFAFFNNIDEKGVYNETRGNVPPLIQVPTPEQAAAIKTVEEELTAIQNQIAKQEAVNVDSILQQWKAAADSSSAKLPQPFWSMPDVAMESQQEKAAVVWSPAGPATIFDGQGLSSAQAEPLDWTFQRQQPLTWMAWIHGDARGAVWGKMDGQASYRGIDSLILDDGRFKIHLINTWEPNSIAVETVVPLPANQWHHVAVSYDGSSKAAGVSIVINGKVAPLKIVQDSLSDTIVTDKPFTLGQRDNAASLKGNISKFRFYPEALTVQQINVAMQGDVVQQWEVLKDDAALEVARKSAVDFVRNLQLLPLQNELASLQARKNDLIANQQTTMVMRERAESYRPTWLLNRGQYDQPQKDEDLWPTVPAALPQLTSEQSKNRLGLAKWMVDDRNPLVARVIVNRTWQKFFGKGLVATSDNFGVQGDPPTHPQLLDWLADDFRSHGWDMKRLQRQIVLSATYQQDSRPTEEKVKVDPENRWLSRGPRYRLSAEQIRDSVLAYSGLLNQQIGGPSVYPYQPEGLWDELAGGANGGPYTQSHGSDLYRRSLYTYRKRTVPHPTTSTFDAPSWEKCQVKRSRTNTPLQALAMLNDTTYVEAARRFAERLSKNVQSTVSQQIDLAFQIALSRHATEDELAKLTDGYQQYLEYYQASPEDVRALLSIGDSECSQPDSAALAAMTSVAAVIMNLDEAITRE